MKTWKIRILNSVGLSAFILCSSLIALPRCSAVGVTIITHGYSGNVTGWISAMANAIPAYYHKHHPGISTNFTVYTLTLTCDGYYYYYQSRRDAGIAPIATDTGEIIIKLDWSQLAGGHTAAYDCSTYNVAWIASYALMQTNAIPDLNGHALVEYPLHLIGHSRGASLMNQICCDLGTNGIWVDHLTTLDPHPCNNDGNYDPFLPQDAPAIDAWDNVLFRDNYYELLGSWPVPVGEPVKGAYNRQFTTLQYGYTYTSSDAPYHSNVHLWYHGTIDTNTPVTYYDDCGLVAISAVARTSWCVPYEERGINAGFIYSLIGGGDRLSADRPLGSGSSSIRDGYNQHWDLGAGTNNNRTTLPVNKGVWPNLISFKTTGAVPGTLQAEFYYQNAGRSNVTVEVYFDSDLNPCTTNGIKVFAITLPPTGSTTVSNCSRVELPLTNLTPGIVYAVYAKISDGVHNRYLYAPQGVEVLAPLNLVIAKADAAQYRIGVSGAAGETFILQTSTNLHNWTSILTNTLTTAVCTFTNSPPAHPSKLFYRAALVQ